MESEVIGADLGTDIYLAINSYKQANTVTIKYKTATTRDDASFSTEDGWITYTGKFISAGYVKVRVEF